MELAHAMLCLDCDWVDVDAMCCTRCSSHAVQPVARWLKPGAQHHAKPARDAALIVAAATGGGWMKFAGMGRRPSPTPGAHVPQG